MKFILSTSTTIAAIHGWVRQPLCRNVISARYMSHKPEAHVTKTKKNTSKEPFQVLEEAPEQVTFDAVGIKQFIISALQKAFPNVSHPTSMQKRIIPAVLGQRDVLIQDHTGTGKSFALLLALLSKPNLAIEGSSCSAINVLLLVPHRDLAYQFLHWSHQLSTSTASPFPLASHVKILVRGEIPEHLPPDMQSCVLSPTDDGAARLGGDPPRILVATPQAVQDMHSNNPSVLQLSSLSTVVVDEVDSQLEWTQGHVKQKSSQKIRRKHGKHPMALMQLLDALYPSKQSVERRAAAQHVHKVFNIGRTPTPRPQLIVLSATLRHRLRTSFFGEFGWFKRDNVMKLIKAGSKSGATHGANRATIHHVLVVSRDGTIQNIRGALRVAARDTIQSQALTESEEDEEDEDDYLYDNDGEDMPEGEVDAKALNAVAVINPSILDAVAATFALDVPNTALLVLPSTASVRRAVFDMRALGVNAHGMDLTANEAGRLHLLTKNPRSVEESPTMLVSTLATTRGIDLPALTHVFLVGVPDGRAADSYLHIAGRVGRFGRGVGKVITVVEDRQEMQIQKKGKVVQNDPRKMMLIFSQLGIVPAKLEHFGDYASSG